MDQNSTKHGNYPFVRIPRALLGHYVTLQETHPFGPSVNQMIQSDLEVCPRTYCWVRCPVPSQSHAGELATVRVTREQLDSMVAIQMSIHERTGANVRITDIITARLLCAWAEDEELSQYENEIDLMIHLIEKRGLGRDKWTIGWVTSGGEIGMKVVEGQTPLIKWKFI